MSLLLNGRLAPITSEMGFLETDYISSTNAFIEWQKPIQAERGIQLSKHSVQGNLEAVFRMLLPLTNVEERRFLFVPTTTSWTLYLANGYRGADVTSPMLVLGEKLGCRSVRVVAIPGTSVGQKATCERYGANILEVYGPQSLASWSPIRTIYTMQEGNKWRFRQWGNPFPFEDAKKYKAKRVQDRFTTDVLEYYLACLGIHAFDGSFYLPKHTPLALLVEKNGPTSANVQSFILEEDSTL